MLDKLFKNIKDEIFGMFVEHIPVFYIIYLLVSALTLVDLLHFYYYELDFYCIFCYGTSYSFLLLLDFELSLNSLLW